MVSGSVVAEVEDDHIQHASQTTGWSSNPAEEQHTLLFLYSISYQCNSNFKLFVSVHGEFIFKKLPQLHHQILPILSHCPLPNGPPHCLTALQSAVLRVVPLS
jgi:hypothetical protein